MTRIPKKTEIICIKPSESIVQNNNSQIVIGQIRKTVGLKGWLRVGLLTDFPDRFEPGEELFLKKQNGQLESVTVSDWKPHFTDDAVDILLEGINDCDMASAYVNRLVVISKDEREELDSEDEFYPDELEGFHVLSPKGDICGNVIKMEADAPCPYLVVSTENDGEVMIPFLRKFLGEINKSSKTLKLVEDISFHIPIE